MASSWKTVRFRLTDPKGRVHEGERSWLTRLSTRQLVEEFVDFWCSNFFAISTDPDNGNWIEVEEIE